MSKLYTCTLCKEKKQSFEFFKRNSRPKGISSRCKNCISKSDKEYRDENKDILIKKRKIKWNSDIEDNREKQRYYRRKNSEHIKERERDYYRSNLEKRKAQKNATSAKRYAKKQNACPEWLSSLDHSKIKSIYKLSRALSKKTGIEHQVDHIVPIVSDIVCGLHVPWNLRVITKDENLRKGNHIIEDIV